MTTLLTEFLHDCGATGPFRLDLEDPSTSGTLHLEFAQPFVRIGRRPNMDLRLDHWQVSRRHAYLQIVAGRLVWVDLGSRTGTYAEGQPGPSGWMNRERGIWVGPYSLKLGTSDLDGPAFPIGLSPLSARAAADLNLPRITLEFPESGASKTTWRMRPALALVGGAATCRVRFLANSPDYVSSLIRTPGGLYVVDLLGQGVIVNGSLVRVARLEDGDLLEIGRRNIRVHYETGIEVNGHSSDHAETSALLASRPIGALIDMGRSGDALPSPSTLPLPDISDEHPAIAGRMGPSEQPGHQLALVGDASPALPQPYEAGPHGMITDLNHPALQPLARQFAIMQQEMMDQFQESMLAMMQAFGDLYREQMGDLRRELDEIRTLGEELKALQAKAAAAPPPPPPPKQWPAGIPPRGRGSSSSSGAEHPSEPIKPRRSVADSHVPNGRADAVDHAAITMRIAEIQAERQGKLQTIMGRLMGRSPGPAGGN